MKSTTEKILESATARILALSDEEQEKAAQEAYEAVLADIPQDFDMCWDHWARASRKAQKEVHQKIMDKLEKMTPSEILQHAKDLGIYDQDGDLTEHYRSEEDHG